ncbi:MAG: glutamine--tRNA ligase/YqeY domain fusion protein [Polyangiales bacterium]
MSDATETPSDFVREMVARDVKSGKYKGRVCTRFPPEPNGYLHIGHAKSIHLNFGIARDFGGVCHLRMDDTNPTTESIEYVGSIQRDVRWLGFDWGDKLFFASDYYPKLHAYAEKLIKLGRAYVCHQTEEEMSKGRGTVSEPGTPSPWRDRSPDENLELFRKMTRGEFKEGEAVLRAKIDMASPNLKMRDPNIYRIKKSAHHYRQGDTWVVYPLYDFAHCLSDAIEGITHSICTMEFENARELYTWVLRATECDEGFGTLPEQTEFARLNLTYTVMSKRKLIELVEGGHVRGWDDPRLPTIAGLRRRGVTPDAIRAFCQRIGVSKSLSIVEIALFEYHIREDLSPRSPRVMAVLKPLKVVIENWPAGEVETLDAPYWPHDIPKEGSRSVPFSGELFIDRDDFAEDPPKGFYRLSPGREVRLRHGYIIKCERVVKGADGEVTELRCTYDPTSRGGAGNGRKVEGTIQWVSAAHAVEAEVRLYDRLFNVEAPGTERDFKLDINPDSLTLVRAKVEPSLASAKVGEHYQFERIGFFVVDADSADGAPVFNRTVSLKDAWTRAVTRASGEATKPAAKPAKEAPRESKEPAKAVELDAAAVALRDKHGVSADEARLLSGDEGLRSVFEGALAKGAKAKAAASLLSNEVVGELRARKLTAVPFGGGEVAELLALVDESVISSKQARDVLGELFANGGSPRAIVDAKGWRQITDTSAVEAAVDEVLAKNADAVGRYRAGNANVLGALVGMAIKATGGKGNPKLVTEVVKRKLG